MALEIPMNSLIPEWYSPATEPSYMGKGAHSVNQLESICEQYKELVHQLQLQKFGILAATDATIIDSRPASANEYHLTQLPNGDVKARFVSHYHNRTETIITCSMEEAASLRPALEKKYRRTLADDEQNVTDQSF